LTQTYDVLVAGGSIAGLAFASEAAKRGAKVLVAEEHPEIGEPEKCDGLVNLRGLRKYGYPPDAGVIQSEIAAAVIHSPTDAHFRWSHLKRLRLGKLRKALAGAGPTSDAG
jgi:flavin-dependent dehydrogenase